MVSKGELAKLRARKREYLVYDSRFLFLRVYPSGRKSWIFRRRIDGKDRQTTLGEYPDMSISDARVARDNAIQADKIRKTNGMCLGDLFELWIKERRVGKVVPVRVQRERRYINFLQSLHKKNVGNIERAQIISILRHISEKSLNAAIETAEMLKLLFDFAADIGEVEEPHIAVNLTRALPRRKDGHFASIHDPREIQKLLRALETIESRRLRVALKVIIYTFVRHSELRLSRWRDIDIENAVWTIPAGNTKMRREHVVPLSRQVIELLNTLNNENSDDFIFGHLSHGILIQQIQRLQQLPPELRPQPTTIHGFRSMASTILNEHEWPSDAIERQLAHVSSGVRAVYNKAQYFDTRRRMMQWYADYLDALQNGKPEPKK